MLRHRNHDKESDRFITAKSAERDNKINKYLIQDREHSSSLSHKNKSKTISLMSDEKQYSQQMYLSFLKSQIFQPSPSTTPHYANCSSNKYPKAKSSLLTTPNNKSKTHNISIVKNLNEASFNCLLSNKKTNKKLIGPINQPETRKENELLGQLDYGSCERFRSLINFDIDEPLSTIKYLSAKKKIPQTAYKVLDSPDLQDDFYLHLLDWSKKDCLAVGLLQNFYIWNGITSKVELLGSLSNDLCTSVCWNSNGEKLFIGTNNGNIDMWDVNTKCSIASYLPRSDRIDKICTMNLNANVITVCSKDKSIVSYDIRCPSLSSPIMTMNEHSQEVCGLKWSLDDRRLASGANDNKLIIWNGRTGTMEYKLNAHKSAIKAIDWSPHQFGYLLSGGGTEDRMLKLWNINTMTLVESIETCSQVCNVAFSKTSHELVSTHGYTDNLIVVWDSNKMEVKTTLKGHKDRVIYMTVGPDNQSIATGAADDSIRFWKVFQPDYTNGDEEEYISPKRKINFNVLR